MDLKKLKPGARMKNYFSHPATGKRVYILLDVVHMIKLLRNLLDEYKNPHARWRRNMVEAYSGEYSPTVCRCTLPNSLADSLA